MTDRGIIDVQAELLAEARKQTKELATIKTLLGMLLFLFVLVVLFAVLVGTR